MEKNLYTYKAKVTRVIDGDTYEMDVDMGFHIHNHITCRVLDLDTPEKRGVEKDLGMICTRYAKNMIEGYDVYIRTVKTDSFGRWLCEVYYISDDNVTDSLVSMFDSWGVNKLRENYDEMNVITLGQYLNEFADREY